MTKAGSSRRPWSAASIIGTVGERRKLLSADCPGYVYVAGRCVRLGALNPLLGGSERSQGGPRWVSVVSVVHDQGPQPVPRYLDRLNGRDSADWQQLYGHPIYFLETFIDPARFRGTCYRAANWLVLGRTTGRGHNASTMRPTRPVKEVLGSPLVTDWRARLTRTTT